MRKIQNFKNKLHFGVEIIRISTNAVNYNYIFIQYA